MKNIYFKLLLAILAIFAFSNLYAGYNSGITLDLKNIPQTVQLNNVDYSVETIPDGFNQIIENKQKNKILSLDENWLLLDSINLHSYIQPNGNLGVKFYPLARHMDIVGMSEPNSEVLKAINKSPEWIRVDLENTLSMLPEAKQLELADVINSAYHPYIDEIAFVIANTSPNFLVSGYCYRQLFSDNARLLYENDKQLNYVDIVDYGDTNAGDYYSTVKYWKINSAGEKVQIEVPRDIYYWYIVHTKLSDEIPTFIKPSYIECNPDQSNHTLNIQPPDRGGVFWRDFLFTHTEEKLDSPGEFYPVLKDSISNCEVLWDDTNQNKSAIKTITNWVNDVMDFTDKGERPHQPVRIYALHIGRCGEHEDITNATARTCLIPCRGISTLSTDHVWNEFWDEQWEQWEPVNNSHKNKMAYSGRKYG
ncbi:MAG: transglutaminase domain-containing protein, partial [bacterium]